MHFRAATVEIAADQHRAAALVAGDINLRRPLQRYAAAIGEQIHRTVMLINTACLDHAAVVDRAVGQRACGRRRHHHAPTVSQ